MAIRSKTIEHIYDDYNLYSATYSRNPSYKMGEALGALFTMHELQRRDPVAFKSFNVLEILGGHSEHQHYMNMFKGDLDIANYKFLDAVPGASDVIVGDVLYTKFSDMFSANFAVGFFFSASSVMDLRGTHRSLHARSVLLALYKNIYENLPAAGAFMLDFVNNGYENALFATESTEDEEFEVSFFHPLRKEYGIPPWGACMVKMTRKVNYDRLTGMNMDYFTVPATIEHEGKVYGRITIKQPMTQRYFSETELIDIALDAGFDNVMMLQTDYKGNDYKVLENKIELDKDDSIDEDNIAEYSANVIVALKGVSDA